MRGNKTPAMPIICSKEVEYQRLTMESQEQYYAERTNGLFETMMVFRKIRPKDGQENPRYEDEQDNPHKNKLYEDPQDDQSDAGELPFPMHDIDSEYSELHRDIAKQHGQPQRVLAMRSPDAVDAHPSNVTCSPDRLNPTKTPDPFAHQLAGPAPVTDSRNCLDLTKTRKPITDQPPGPASPPWSPPDWLVRIAKMAVCICGHATDSMEGNDNSLTNHAMGFRQGVEQKESYDDGGPSQDHLEKLKRVLKVLRNKAGIRLNSLQFKALEAIKKMLDSKIKGDLNSDITRLEENLNLQAPELLRVIYDSTQESDNTKNRTFKDKMDLVSGIVNEIRGNFGPRKSGAVTLQSSRSASKALFEHNVQRRQGRPISAPPMGAKGQLPF